MKSPDNIKKMNNDEMAAMLGYPPNAELRRKIIDECRTTGADLREVAAKYSLPTVEMLNAKGRFWSDQMNAFVTPAEFRAAHPLGKHLKFYEMPNEPNK